MRVANVASNTPASTVAVTAATLATGTSKTSAITYTLVQPVLTINATLTPASGDAGDSTRYCATLRNTASGVCA